LAWDRRAALVDEARPTGEAILGGGAISRRLAAIFAVDVVGSSCLMETEEVGTLARDYRTTGDGPLDEFASGVDTAPISAS
jgi:class 3 adenylate cyclase